MKNLKRPFLVIFFSLIFMISSGFTVVGHRGDPTKYPEETIQSINSAFHSGADYVELDLHLSKDGVPVISHDDDLFRVTHIHRIVSQNDFRSLSQLQYDNGEHVLSLSELLNYYQKKPNTKFILETKIDHSLDKSYELEDKLAYLIKHYHMEDKIIVHSFSAASLFYLHKIFPELKLIFIVGSLKRINFSIIPQVSGVNIASDLIRDHPWVIHWLHRLHKKVFVWTEMDESPDLWQWLINKNVDGVVTNFPELGYKYKLAKSGTSKYEINRPGIYFGIKKTAIMMNPYVRIKEKRYVYPGEKLNVMYGVRIDDRLYYQIAQKTFISAEFVSLDLTPEDVRVYRQKKVIDKPDKKVYIYNHPNNLAKSTRILPAGKQFKILNFNGSPRSLWIYTDAGWVKAKDILFYGFFDSESIKAYSQLRRLNRYNNIALLKFKLPVQPEFSYSQKMQKTYRIIY